MKIKELQKILRKKKADFALFYNLDSLSSDANLFYFTGYKGIGILIISKEKRPFLLVPEMEIERAKKSFKNSYKIDKKKLFDSIKSKLRKHKIKTKKIALDKSKVTLNFNKLLRKNLKNFKSIGISSDCLKLRGIKTYKEMQNIKKACSIADKIFSKLIKNFKNFDNETDASSFLEFEAKKIGCENSFPPIVASGKNSSMPHYDPENIKLKKGFCVIDFGVKYKGYCSDMTRTIFIGKPSKKEKEIYNFLLNIQKNIINEIKLNKKCSEIYNYCIKELKDYKKHFTHGLGHGLGVEIHELPNLTLDSKDKIEKNMIFTIEPGIYFPDKFGIRIEDTILMKNKLIILTKTKKELIILN